MHKRICAKILILLHLWLIAESTMVTWAANDHSSIQIFNSYCKGIPIAFTTKLHNACRKTIICVPIAKSWRVKRFEPPKQFSYFQEYHFLIPMEALTMNDAVVREFLRVGYTYNLHPILTPWLKIVIRLWLTKSFGHNNIWLDVCRMLHCMWV